MTRVTSRREAEEAVRRETPDASSAVACEIAWTISARALGDRAGRTIGDAELVWRIEAAPRVEVRVGGRARETDALPSGGLRIEEHRDADLTHVRVLDSRGVCWLDATIRTDDRPGVLYARTRAFDALGLGGGRYSAPEWRGR